MSARHVEMARQRWVKVPAYAHPPAVIDRIKRLRLVHSQEATAEIVGVSKAYVSRIEARGFKPGVPGRPAPERPGDFAIQCNHMSMIDLAAHYGVHRSTVRRWLIGLTREYKSARVYEKMPIPPREQIEEALRRGTVAQALEHFGVAAATFRSWRKHYGMPIAPRRKRCQRLRRAAA